MALSHSAVGFSSALASLLIWGMFFCSEYWPEELEFTFPQLLCTGPDCYHQKGTAAQLLRNSNLLAWKGPFKSF